MSSRIGIIQRPWSTDELDVLRRGLAAGKRPAQIAPELPTRTVEAVKTRARLIHHTGHSTPRRPMAAPAVRIDTLVRTIAAAAKHQQDEDDKAYLRQLRGGLLGLLAARHGVVVRAGQEVTA